MGALNHLFYWGITPILQLLPLKLSITSVLQMIPFFTIQVWNLRNKDKVWSFIFDIYLWILKDIWCELAGIYRVSQKKVGSQKISNCSNSLNFEAKINCNTIKQNVPKWRKTCIGLKFYLLNFYGPQSNIHTFWDPSFFWLTLYIFYTLELPRKTPSGFIMGTILKMSFSLRRVATLCLDTRKSIKPWNQPLTPLPNYFVDQSCQRTRRMPVLGTRHYAKRALKQSRVDVNLWHLSSKITSEELL